MPEDRTITSHGARVGTYVFDAPTGWEYETIEVVQTGQLQRTGPTTVVFNAAADVWAIRKRSYCWPKDGDAWEYEPSPSSRDDEYYARCRYTLAEALPLAAEIRDVENARRADGR